MRSGALRPFWRVVVAVCLSTWSLASAAQGSGSPSLGLAWLQAQVQADGSVSGEAASIATRAQVRTEVLNLLAGRSAPSAALVAAVAAESESNNEYLARRALALKAAGQSADALAGALLASQGADGGWGLADSYGSDVLDTAFAVEAIARAGRATGGSTASSLAYLMSSRLADGAWGVNTAASIYMTAQVLLAAVATSDPSATALVSAARDALLARRSAGHFGDTVDNSLAFLALFSQTDDAAILTPILDAIRASQGADGSWAGDPFVTAIALRALFAWQDSYAGVRGRIVHAATNSPIAGASVSLSTVPPVAATTDANGAFEVTGVRPGTYSLSISATGFGVFATPVGLSTGQVLDVGTLPLQPDAATGATVHGVVTRADTGAVVSDALVTVSLGGRSFSAYTDAAGAYRIEGILAGDAHLTVVRSGFNSLMSDRTVAAGGVYDESPRLYPTTAGAQLDGLILDMETGLPLEGVAITLGAPNAATAATNANGRFGITGLAGGTGSIKFALPGYYTLEGTVTLAAGQTLFTTLAMPPTIAGTTVRTLKGRVLDSLTRLPITGVYVDVYLDGVTYLYFTDADGWFRIPGYRGGTIEFGFAKDGYEQSSHIYGAGNPAPTDLGDFVLMPDQAGSLLADLGVANLDRRAVIEGASGALSGSLAVRVKNSGRSAAGAPFQVRAFYDVDRDGAFTPGVDAVLGEITMSGPGGQMAADTLVDGTIALAGSLPFRDAPIHVWVDSGFAVVEANENDNVVSTSAFCRLCASSSVVPPPTNFLPMEPEFAGSYTSVNLGPFPAGPNPYTTGNGFIVPKRGDVCTLMVGYNAAASSGSVFAVKIARDDAGHVIGFGRVTRTADAFSVGWGASYLGSEGPLLALAWNAFVNGSYTHGLYAYKPEDTQPGKFINLLPHLSGYYATSVKVVPEGFPGAGKLKATTWPYGEWHSGTIGPDGNGYATVSSLARVPGTALVGRPHDFTYVPKGAPGFARDSILVSEWSANVLAAYEVDVNGDPIVATRRPFLQGIADVAGAAFDPISGDLIATRYGGNGNEQRVVSVRGFSGPARTSDLTVSRAVAAIDTAGRVSSVTARIGNAGPGASATAKLGVYAVRNGTRGELLAEIALAPLASTEYRDQTIVMPAPVAAPGVMVVADSGEALLECTRENNSAVIAVQALLGTVVVAADLPAYAPDSVANIVTTVANPGVAVTGYAVALAVIDVNGNVISDLGRRPIDALAAGGSTNLEWSWTVPSVLAGGYRIRASLLNLSNSPLGEAIAPVEILAVPAAPVATLAVTTDKPGYGPFDVVAVGARVTNAQGNSILQGLRVGLRVLGAGGTVLASSEQAVSSLPALTGTNLAFSVPLAGAPAGGYIAEITVRDASGAILAREASPFVVVSTGETGNEVSGTLSLSGTEVVQGASLTLAGAVTNVGNADLAALQMSLTVIDPATGAVQRQWTQVAPAPRQQAVPFVATWAVPTSVAPGTYAAVLAITVNGASRTLAQATFAVLEPPILLTGTVAADKAAYDALETATFTGQLTNAAAGRSLSGLRIRHRVQTSTGIVIATTETAPFDLPAGASVTRSTTFATGVTPPGTHSVVQLVVDAAGATLDTRQAAFEIRSSAQTGVGIAGTLSASPQEVEQGGTVALSATLANGGNADVGATEVKVTVRDPAQATVTQFTTSLPISRAQPSAFANSWTVPAAQPIGSYSATLTALVGTSTLTLAHESFLVKRPPVQLELTQSFAGRARVLVLLSCKPDDDDEVNDDGPDDAPCITARSAFLGGYLGGLGVTHRIVTTTADFRRHLRAGAYNVYWLSGGATKLRDLLPGELREAVHAGATLVMDGVHDSRNKALDDIVGVKYRGKLSPVDQPIAVSSAVFTPGTLPTLGRPLKLDLEGGASHATFGATQQPAVVTAAYGLGKGILLAFDWAGTLATNASSPLWTAFAREAFAWATPPARTPLTAAGHATLATVVRNLGIATEIEVVVAPSGGAKVVEGSPAPTIDPAGMARWRVPLAEAATMMLDALILAPAASGQFPVATTISTISGGVPTPWTSLAATLEVSGAVASSTALVNGLNALALASKKDRDARDAAVKLIGEAVTKLGQNAYEDAIEKLLQAADELSAIAGADMTTWILAVDRMLAEAGRRWYEAQP